MRIVNKELRRQFSVAGACELCRAYCRAREPHHWYFAKGMGSGRCYDVRPNLISLGQTWECECHRRLHDSTMKIGGIEVDKDVLCLLVAQRERVPQPSIHAVMRLIDQCSKSPTLAEVARRAEGFTLEARALLKRTFLETPEHQHLAEAT